MNGQWLIKLNAQWFPAGLLYLIRVGLADGHMDDALWLSGIGFTKPDVSPLSLFPMRKVIAEAGITFTYLSVCVGYFTTTAQDFVMPAAKAALYDPDTIHGLEVSIAVTTDPRMAP